MRAGAYDDDYYAVHAERVRENSRFHRHRVANVLSLLKPQPTELVLDLGCGVGSLTLACAQAGARCIGLDYELTGLRLARDLVAEIGLTGALPLVCADACLLPFAASSIPAIVAADLTEHLTDDALRDMLAQCHIVLRPGGRLVIYTPCPAHWVERLKARGIIWQPDPTHIGLRSSPELAEAVSRAGFEVARIACFPLHVPLAKSLERVASRLPVVGPLFRRRIGLLAIKP
ncbi:MAG: class I SAM-dependent methyltransferase [Armatimonadota bacterium]